MKKLIVNADDFGIGERVSDGILECHMNGIVSSTTIMTNMPAAEYSADRLSKHPKLGVGIHFVLTHGRPLSPIEDVPDLVDDEGKFLGPRQQAKKCWFNKRIYKQVEIELRAQLKRAFELDLKISHCDSHHGIHRMPLVREAVGNVITELKHPRVRNQLGYYWARNNSSIWEKSRMLMLNAKYSHKIIGHLYNHWALSKINIKSPNYKVTPRLMVGAPKHEKEMLIASITSLKEGVSEMIFHPGFPDPCVKDSDAFAKIRQSDLQVLTDLEVINTLNESDVQLVSYNSI